jgi:hypothetical protein
MRGYPESIRSSAGHSLRVSGADNVLVLQQDGLLHGARALRGTFFFSFRPAYVPQLIICHS